jgi:hypothetical protein
MGIDVHEKATHVVDMNKPLAIEERYDTVIDAGTIEHIYNAPQALANVSAMCAHQGQILHIGPANIFCGHGFWQFSPELFFSLYSENQPLTFRVTPEIYGRIIEVIEVRCEAEPPGKN